MLSRKTTPSGCHLSGHSSVITDQQKASALKQAAMGAMPLASHIAERVRKLVTKCCPTGKLPNASVGILACLTAIASSSKKDPEYLAAVTNCDPLFIVALQWALSVNHVWQGRTGEVELAELIAEAFEDDTQVHEHLDYLLEWIWNDPSRDLLDLEKVWELCTGVPVGS